MRELRDGTRLSSMPTTVWYPSVSSSLSVRWLPTGSSISGFEFSTSAVLMSFCASSTDGSVPTIVQMRSRVIGMTSSMAEMRMRVPDVSLILLSTSRISTCVACGYACEMNSRISGKSTDPP